MAHGSACVVWHKDADGIVHVLMGVESRYLTDYMDTLNFGELNALLRGDRDAGKKPGAISARMEELHLHATPGCCNRDARNIKTLKPEIPLAEFQKIPVAHCSLEHSKPIFERRAKALQGLIGPRVQYDTPVVDSGNHTVNFRIVVDPTTLHSLEVHSERTGGFTLKPNVRGHMSSFGILKGRKNEGETFEAAMARELAEESGTMGGGVALTAIGERGLNHFFALELTAGQKETWQTHIASRLTRNSGELFNLGWVPCFDAGMNVMRPLRPLDSDTTPSLLVRVHPSIAMNGVSSAALELFRDACLSGRIPGCMPPAPAAAASAAPAAAAVAPFHAHPYPRYASQHGPPRSHYEQQSQHGPPRSSQHGHPRSQYSSQYGSPRSSHRSSQHDSRSHHGQHRGVNKPPHKGHGGGKTRKTNKKTFKRRK